MPEVTTPVQDPAKTRYGVGDIVQLLPDPYSEGPHPFDFDMPAPFAMITGVETHTYNPEWVLGYDVREIGEDGGDTYKIKPGKIAGLVLDADLVKRVRCAAARDHMLRDPYRDAERYPDGVELRLDVRDRLYFARRAREERTGRTAFGMPACRPWMMVHVEIVRRGEEEKRHDCLASVEVTYGLGNPARAIYGVGRDGVVYCWAD